MSLRFYYYALHFIFSNTPFYIRTLCVSVHICLAPILSCIWELAYNNHFSRYKHSPLLYNVLESRYTKVMVGLESFQLRQLVVGLLQSHPNNWLYLMGVLTLPLSIFYLIFSWRYLLENL